MNSIDTLVDLVSTDLADCPTAENVAEYRSRGYWVSPRLFSDAQIARMRSAQERLWAGDFDSALPSPYGIAKFDAASPSLRQQCNAFWLNDEIRTVVTSPILGAIAGRLMGVSSVRLWHDQAIYKPGLGASGHSELGNVGWHQDYGYWQASNTTNMCTAWIALQDTDLSNGGMRTIVGSHRWGLLEGSDTFWERNLEALRDRYSANGEWIDEPCIMKAGQVSFHHCLTLHGSGPNFSREPRLSLISHMMPGDAAYSGSSQAHPNTVFLGPSPKVGVPFREPFFPEVWRSGS